MASLEDYLRNFAKAGSGFAAPSARWVSFTPVVDTGNEAWGHETAPSVGLFVIKFVNANIGSGISKTRLHTPILAGQLSASAQGRATCPVTRAMQSRTTLGAQADKPRMQVPLRSTSFLLSVASNNARMEVAA